jgi:tRNA(Arg) A34 adenosine deaminase TadA
MPTPVELNHLRRCIEVAAMALEEGNEPFGSVLVASNGSVLAEDHNRVGTGDPTRHPELELARWAAVNMTPLERAAATVFTSGEHCPMCSAAHGWVGLGKIVYVSSSEQLASWLGELGVPPSPVRALRIQEVVPGVAVEGPVPSLVGEVRDLHRQYHGARRTLIERYIAAYNAFDVEGMVKLLHPDEPFANVASGEVTAAAKGRESFRALAERAATLFATRRQSIRRYTPSANGAEVEVDYVGVLARDLGPKLRAGESLRLQGKSTFEIREGKLARIVDES